MCPDSAIAERLFLKITPPMPHSILIIDDDPQILKMLSDFLGHTLGYQITAVADAEQAIETALGRPFDLCIVDVHLPGRSGSEVYMRLKNMIPQIEGIFFTADQEFEQRLDFLRFALPADRVLKKPLGNLSELTKLIISILGPPR
jgi:CheY-like chemotaxis protein